LVASVAPAYPQRLDEIAYHGLAGDIVRLVEPHSEADPVALLLQVLVAFGSIIHRSAYWSVEGDRHHGNLFLVLVGETSKGRKGSSWGQVRRVVQAADPDWAAECVVSGLASGEGLMHAVRDRVTKIGKNGEEVEDAGVSDKRLLGVEEEFASVLRQANRDSNIITATLRQAWDTGNLRTLTKTTPTRATNAHVSVIGHITVDELRQELTKTDKANGFANRFLWVMVRRSKVLPEGGALHTENLQPLTSALNRAAREARTRGELTRDSAARALWRDVYPELTEGHPGMYGAVTGRGEAQVLRLAML
jgi:hypothetical protein